MDFYNTHILTVVLFTPLVGALVLLFVPRDSANMHRVIGNLFAFLGLIVSLPLIWRFSLDPGAPRYQFSRIRLIRFPSIGAHYSLGIDGISLLLGNSHYTAWSDLHSFLPGAPSKCAPREILHSSSFCFRSACWAFSCLWIFPLLHVLGSDAGAHVFPDRRVGQATAACTPPPSNSSCIP